MTTPASTLCDIPTNWRTIILNPAHTPDTVILTGHGILESNMSVTIAPKRPQAALEVRE